MGKKAINKCIMKDNRWFLILTFLSIGFLIAGFIVPPLGIIDNSVLKGVGLILGFGALGTVLKAIELGVAAKFKHNNTSVEIDPDGELNEE